MHMFISPSSHTIFFFNTFVEDSMSNISMCKAIYIFLWLPASVVRCDFFVLSFFP